MRNIFNELESSFSNDHLQWWFKLMKHFSFWKTVGHIHATLLIQLHL